MMSKEGVDILILENLHLVMDVYRLHFKALSEENPHWKFNILYGSTSNKAVYILKNQSPPAGFDLAIIDNSIAPSTDGKYLSGQDIAQYIRAKHPKTKLLFNTSAEQAVIASIFKNINPEGFLIKTEGTGEILKRAVSEILYGGSYYGKSVLQIMKSPFKTNLVLDEWDRKLLYELGRGTKTTQIPEILPLSLSTVARRKRRLKEIFGIEGLADRELLKRAREMGFL